MTNTATVWLHPWEDRGFKAPYQWVAVFEEKGNTCQVCGMCIKECHVIRDSAGTTFIVGCDCVRKTGRSELVTAAEAAHRNLLKIKREEKARIEMDKRVAAQALVFAAERKRNGGLTDYELSVKKAEDAKLAITTANAWLLDELAANSWSDFARSISSDLKGGTRADCLTERCFGICAEIIAKGYGRRGSKAYAAKEDELWGKYNALRATN